MYHILYVSAQINGASIIVYVLIIYLLIRSIYRGYRSYNINAFKILIYLLTFVKIVHYDIWGLDVDVLKYL
jgi:hypothetical protein